MLKQHIVNEGDTCVHCNLGTMVLRNGKYGDFLGCSEYPRCMNIKNFSKGMDDLEKQANKILRQK